MKKLLLLIGLVVLIFVYGCEPRVQGSKHSTNYEKSRDHLTDGTWEINSTSIVGEYTMSSCCHFTSEGNKNVIFREAKKLCSDAIISNWKEGNDFALVKSYSANITCPSVKLEAKDIEKEKKKKEEEKKKKEEEEKLALENEKKIEQENIKQQELASLEKKQQTCETLGFEIGTESNGECVLKLMQMEIDLNKIEEEKTVYVQSGDSNKTAEALARQALRQQEINSSLMLMQQGYNLMKPKPRINCNTTLMGWTCF